MARRVIMTQLQVRRLVSKITVELEYDQIEQIVREELKMMINVRESYWDDPDREDMVAALKRVHNFYSPTEDHI